ncbi:MAG: hypothetical protein AUJ25_00095 [Parcubacteria group bacterium CG1_02_37_13]|nr:MAG: hypothetical protein AUJ25_00095 [Parcubacteria group bacterium CG1_02_37_13]
MVKIINLTPHPVIVLRDDPTGSIVGVTGVGSVVEKGKFALVATIAPAGPVARAAQLDKPAGEVGINGYPVPLIMSSYGEPNDLPAPKDGTLYVVSILTAQAAKAAGRITSDLLVTSDPVRDAAGKIVGCRKFAIV